MSRDVTEPYFTCNLVEQFWELLRPLSLHCRPIGFYWLSIWLQRLRHTAELGSFQSVRSADQCSNWL